MHEGDTKAAIPTTALQRATSGRQKRGVSIMDRRTWSSLARAEDGPGLALTALLVTVFVAELFNGGPMAWGLSAAALVEGQWHTLGTHMLAHAGPVHLVMNVSGLLALSPIVVWRLGVGPGGWLRYGSVFVLSGLAGAIVYLAIHPTGAVPMVGASGAICGLWGTAARVSLDGGFHPLRSAQVRRELLAFVKTNLILFTLIFVLVRLAGGSGGLAWEAHVGGFLFGLLIGPRLSPSLHPRPLPDLRPQ